MNDGMDPGTFETILDLMAWRARSHGHRPALSFLDRGEEMTEEDSYLRLFDHARIVAARLVEAGVGGRPVLLCIPSGLIFVRCFLGCLLARAVVAPAPGLETRRGLDRVISMARDFLPAAVITPDGDFPPTLAEALPQGCLRLSVSDLLSGGPGADPGRPGPEDVAFVQYTSGSLGRPRGVVVTHGNIMANQAMIAEGFGHDAGLVGVNWLPLHHDMGLCGSILQTLYVGGRCHVMSPMAFLQRPLRWLQAMQALGGTTSGGPNFGFEVCLRQVEPHAASQLDLSQWRVAFCGAEPIRPQILRNFAARFAPSGFDPAALLPCYGLAEATLFVTSVAPGEGMHSRMFATETVSCGRPLGGGLVRLLSEDGTVAPPGTIGEIAIGGPHVSPGFWDGASAAARPDPAREVRLHGTRFLRTGDIGVLAEGDLHILGRRKDMIIVRGTKIHAEDVEATVMAEAEGMVTAAAAFSVADEGGERLGVVCETVVPTIPDTLRRTLAGRIGEAFGILPQPLVFVRSGAIPRSANGKIRRSACREALLENRLGSARREDAP